MHIGQEASGFRCAAQALDHRRRTRDRDLVLRLLERHLYKRSQRLEIGYDVGLVEIPPEDDLFPRRHYTDLLKLNALGAKLVYQTQRGRRLARIATGPSDP